MQQLNMSEDYIIRENAAIYQNLVKKNRQWRIVVELFDGNNEPLDIWKSNLLSGNYTNDYTAQVYTLSGIIGGKIKESTPRVITNSKVSIVKNRNILTEALEKARSKYARKLNRENFHPEGTDVAEAFEPMLLMKYEPKKFKPGSYIQPKYDGVRSYTNWDNGAVMLSRKRVKFVNIKAIIEEINKLYDSVVEAGVDAAKLHFDGEVYRHGTPFDEVAGMLNAKELDAEEKEILGETVYVLFDLRYDEKPEMRFGVRHELLEGIFGLGEWEHLVLAPTFKVKDDDEVQKYYHQFLDLGFEGAVVKANEPYKSGTRSSNALKVKPDNEAEFEIVGYGTGEGSHEGLLKMRLRAPNGEEFDQMYMGPMKKSKEMYENFKKNFDEYKGKLITLRFRFLNKNGKPEHVMKTVFRTDI